MSCVYDHGNFTSKTQNEKAMKENKELKTETAKLNELLVNTAAKLEKLNLKNS